MKNNVEKLVNEVCLMEYMIKLQKNILPNSDILNNKQKNEISYPLAIEKVHTI